MKVKISKSITLEGIEAYLDKLSKVESDIDLLLPEKIDYRGFGILPSFYLLIFTWMRNNKGNVSVPLSPKNYENFAMDYYGYVILSTLWRHCKILDAKGVDIKNDFRDFTSKMHFNIDSLSKELPKEALVIPNFDHYSKEKGFSHWFYNNSFDFVKTASALDNSIYHILTKVRINNESRVNRNVSDSFDEITKIVWELLKNTDEHSKKDYLDEEKLLPNTRGVFFRVHRSSKTGFINGNEHSGLKDYYEQALPVDDQAFILEISVFDSGPGLVKRFLGNKWDTNISLDDEVRTIKNCLIKGQTSVLTTEGHSKGYGLDEVLRLLDEKKGFLKIRTGRASIYRNLISHRYQKTTNVEEVELFDWKTSMSKNFTPMARTEGTLITLAFPLL